MASRWSATSSSWLGEQVPVEVEGHARRGVLEHLLNNLHVPPAAMARAAAVCRRPPYAVVRAVSGQAREVHELRLELAERDPRASVTA